MKSKLLIIVSLALALGALLASCAKSTDGAAAESAEEAFVSVVTEAPPLDFEPVDVISSLTRSESADYAVSSENYGVDHRTFEALFNYVLFRQLNTQDGFYDEYDSYFEDGSLDPSCSVYSQIVPGTDLYWYAAARSEALMLCFNSLKYLELSKSKDVFPLTRQCEVRVNQEMSRIESGENGEMTDIFGENADETSVRAAVTIWSLATDPSLIVNSAEFASFKHPDFEVDSALNPDVAPAFRH